MLNEIDLGTSSSSDRLTAYVCELERVIGGPLSTVMPPTMYVEEEVDRHEWFRLTAERVGATFAGRAYWPDVEIMLQGLVDFAVRSGEDVMACFPTVDAQLIHADMVDLSIQLLAKTCAADGTRHARRSNGNRIRNLYLERIRLMSRECRVLDGKCPLPVA
jgi:hypothetical protein